MATTQRTGRLLSMDIGDVERLAALLEQAPEIAGEELFAALNAALFVLERDVKELTPTAHGLLRNSIHSQSRIDGDGLLGIVGSPLEYAEYVELGTRPHFPPVEPLQDWVRAKGLASEEREVRNIACMIARAIAVRGTLAVGMFNRAAAFNESNVERIFGLHVQRIAERIAAEGAR